MNMWTKLMTALRGGVNEAGEAIIDSQALRILDQEVRDASEELRLSKDSLAEIIAHQKVAEDKVREQNKLILEFEEHALKALDKGEEQLALEVAEKINALEERRDQEQALIDSHDVNANKLRAAIRLTEQSLKRVKQQIDTVKATESVQRAQAVVAQRHNGSDSKMRTAVDSLERVKEKQALTAAQIEAAEELAQESSDDDLQKKLEAAGVAPAKKGAENVLERLKSQKASKK